MVSLAIAAMWVTSGSGLGLAQQSAQQSFASAAEASKSLFEAVKANDNELIVKILGGPTELASSGDESQDKLDRECFVQKYQEMHRMVREDATKVVLYIGAENWPFPIPLVEKDGAWRFDSDAGLKEVLYRRIGENELTTIATCHDFAAQTHNRANPDAAVPADSFAAGLAAKATSQSVADNPTLFGGYYFRVVATHSNNGTHPEQKGKATGGFALIAYPAQYRSSGVMTFVVTANGVVYEKDMGANTSALAGAMKAYHKDATWRTADE
jgi:hypothetical protein